MDKNMYKYKHGGLHREQELKEPGGRRSWRDEARARLVESLGRTGERLGEGLLGESEEDKYLEFLQRTYGSELPRDEEGSIDVPESRPMRESMLDPSDLGMSDKLLMLLSGGGSLMPRAALTAAGTETGMLLGDAKGEYDKGNTTGAGIMAGLAGLPPAVAAGLNNKTFMDLGREATSGIGQFMKRNVPSIERSSMVTPEGVDVPLYFSKGSGSMTGGGNKMTTELQGYEENFPKLLRPTKGSSMRDNIVGDTEINTGDLETTLNKYNLSFDDMKRIDIDSPEIYNNSSAEGRDMLEGLELLTYPRKKPIYSQDYNEGMGTLDFYDTESGPIGIMQMDIDDSIEEMVFFVPNNRGFNKLNNESAQLKTQRLMETANTETGSRTLNDPAFNSLTSNEQANLLKTQNLMRAQTPPVSLKKLSPIMSSRRLPGHVSNKVAGNDAISASIKGKGRVRGAEVIDSIVRNLQDSGVTGDKFLSNQRFDRTVRMEGTLNGEKVVFNSTPVDNISDEYIVSLRKMNGQGTQLSDRANKIRILENTLHEKTAVRNKEYGAMSVKKLGELDIGIGKLKAEIRSLKALER